MSTPRFATKATATVATDAQIVRAIAPMLEGRDWANAQLVKHVSRAAVLNLVIGWALNPMADSTPAEVSRVVNGTVGRNSTYGERVNAILAHLLANGTAAEGHEFCYAPLTKKGASALIEWLGMLPAKAGNVAKVAVIADAVEVPEGHYAVEITGSTVGNDLAFYRVDRPTEGRWAGFVFVKQIVGPEEQAVRGAAAKTVLAQIAADPAAASIRYGKEIGKCGVCNRRLSNKASRERGIGPDCADKTGW